jgi:hypothetical protein
MPGSARLLQTSLDTVKSFFDFFDRVSQNYGPTVRAAHGAICFSQGRKEPFHFGLVQRHIDFDSGMAGGGGSNFG